MAPLLHRAAIIIIYTFVSRHIVITSEVLGPGSVLVKVRTAKRVGLREEECF